MPLKKTEAVLWECEYALSELDAIVSTIINEDILPVGTSVALSGELGAGKTTFTKAFFSKFGVNDVSSPTYTLNNSYKGADNKGQPILLDHWDLYRCQTLPEELQEDRQSSGIFRYRFVEWAQKFKPELCGTGYLEAQFQIIDDNVRKIIISRWE